MIRETVEYCGNCDTEITLPFDDEKPIYTRVCPKCGAKLMVCNECLYKRDYCDWNKEKGCYRERNEVE